MSKRWPEPGYVLRTELVIEGGKVVGSIARHVPEAAVSGIEPGDVVVRPQAASGPPLTGA